MNVKHFKLKKIDEAKNFLINNYHLFECPLCQAPIIAVDHYSIVCSHGHRFDLSKKGTLFLIKHGVKSDYDDLQLWQARRELLQKGLFDGAIKAILSHLPSQNINVLDIGCGEGTPLAKVAAMRPEFTDNLIGFDISKEAVNLATQQQYHNFFCVADLANLPFTNNSFDILIDILSPSSYTEFDRVLQPNGLLFKIIPNANYLIELRHRLYLPQDKNYSYDNKKVLMHFKEHCPASDAQRITYQFKLTPRDAQNLLKMTPLQWGSSFDPSLILKDPLTKVTVDFTLMITKPVK